MNSAGSAKSATSNRGFANLLSMYNVHYRIKFFMHSRVTFIVQSLLITN